VYTDRDLCKSLLTSAVDFFGAQTLAVLLNVAERDLQRWAQGRERPPTHHLLQVIDLMRPKNGDRQAGGGEGLKVLVATSRRARDAVAGIVRDCPVEFVFSIEEGARALEAGRYSHVVIGYLFADSQMFEFARQTRQLRPEARVICVKAAGRALGKEVRAGLDAAAVELGCEGFFDLTAGELPESFNRVFNEIIAYFHADETKSRRVQELRSAVHELRALA
jgi:hypothetical protein